MMDADEHIDRTPVLRRIRLDEETRRAIMFKIRADRLLRRYGPTLANRIRLRWARVRVAFTRWAFR